MSNSAELTELKKEVALLKEQLRELRSFFTIESVEGQPGRKTLLIDCSGILLQNPANPNLGQVHFYASEQGPSLAFWGDDGKARIIIDVEKNKGRVRLFEDELKQIVDIGVDGKNNPQIGVLFDGKPRAVMKATPDMGAISAVHDDGAVRAFMCSQFDHGEMFVVGGDMKAAVKLSADGMDGGGYLTVNHANGKSALILSSTQHGGGILSNTSQGQQLALWPNIKNDTGAEED
jgi:hypothetical protein